VLDHLYLCVYLNAVVKTTERRLAFQTMELFVSLFPGARISH
jgi:hypothetical protein